MISADVASLADRILAPLAGRPAEAWSRAPAGKWCAGQIVHHLALSIGNSANGFASRVGKPAMVRRPSPLRERVFRFAVLRVGVFGIGRQAPEATRPQQAPAREATEALLREGAARFAALAAVLLPARATDLFLKHPVLGDLTYAEWGVFHERHAAHHLKQLRQRIAQL